MALAGCRSSCSEDTGAEPVVVDAGPVLGAPRALPARPIQMRPMAPIRMQQLHSAAPANSE